MHLHSTLVLLKVAETYPLMLFGRIFTFYFSSIKSDIKVLVVPGQLIIYILL